MQNTPFDIIQGDTWSFEIEYTDELGNPINISNYNIVAEVRDKPGGEILCATSNSTDGITLKNFPQTTNVIDIVFTPEKTMKFNLPKSAYQVKVIETGDTLLTGWINVEPGVIYG